MPDHDDGIDAAFNDLVRTELASVDPRMCECKCNGAEPHSDRLCGRRATMFVALHRWGWCDEPPDAAGFTKPDDVDADGNITSLMCEMCATHALAVGALKIKAMLAGLPPDLRADPHCPTCGRRMAFASDLVMLRPL